MEKVNKIAEFCSCRPVRVGRPWLAAVNGEDGLYVWQRVRRDGRGKSDADWTPLVDQDQQGDILWEEKWWAWGGRCVIGRSVCKSHLVGFRHAVAVPASCDCSSDARRSAWQSSSCSFVYECCRDTKMVKEGGKEDECEHLVRGKPKIPPITMHTIEPMHPNTRIDECSFCTLTSRFMLPFLIMVQAQPQTLNSCMAFVGSEIGWAYSK